MHPISLLRRFYLPPSYPKAVGRYISSLFGRLCSHSRSVAARPERRLSVLALLVGGLLLLQPATLSTHDIPADVTVQAIVKAQGQRLRMLIRVPLVAMQDFNFPQREEGYIDVEAAESMLRDAIMVWVGDELNVYEEDTLLTGQELVAVQVSHPTDRSFATYNEALARITQQPLSNETNVYFENGLLDAMFEYPISSDQSNFSTDLTLARLGLRTVTVLRLVLPDGTVRPFEYSGNPGLVRLDPRWHQAAFRFVALGFEHILDGIDHLLFLACLVIPFRRLRPLIAIVTSFTVAHSVTLIASAFDLAPAAAWFPPLVETAIALSIVYMAVENIVGVKLRRRWLIAFGFGLVHGFGFSFALRETLQFAGPHLLMSLLSFNIGVELGQLMVLVVLIPALGLLFRIVPERIGAVLLSALVAHTGWHWMSERASALALFDLSLQPPQWNLSLVVNVLQWGTLVLVIAGLLWLMSIIFPQTPAVNGKPPAPPSSE